MTAPTCGANRRALYTLLLRGALGLALLAAAVSEDDPLVAMSATLVALIAFRGCPMCWVFGLIERGAHNCAPGAQRDAS